MPKHELLSTQPAKVPQQQDRQVDEQPPQPELSRLMRDARPASIAAARSSNRPKTVAPDPDIRVSRQPGAARMAASAASMPGVTARAGASRSFRWADSQSMTEATDQSMGHDGRSASPAGAAS